MISKSVFTCSILASIVTILIKYCDNTYEYWANTWKMCSPASVIFASIVTILLSNFNEVFCKYQLWKLISKQWSTTTFEIHQNCFKTYKDCDNTCEYCTCRLKHFVSIGSILVFITTIHTSIVTLLVSNEQVNTP